MMNHEFQFPDAGSFERDAVFTFGAGMAAGAAIGLALGLLLAPKRGAALRRGVVARAKDLARTATAGSRLVRAEAGGLASRGHEVAEHADDATEIALREARRHAATPPDVGDQSRVPSPVIEKRS